jgi:D-alanyl-D-alanine carboxypeptidase/D-alanyl-D-alanine-endopeptidase (penicillin-binding protein 4)
MSNLNLQETIDRIPNHGGQRMNRVSMVSFKIALALLCLLSVSIAIPCCAAAETSDSITLLQASLRQLIAKSGLNEAGIGVYVEDATSHRSIFSFNGDVPLTPASCNKLHTTAAALYYLGSNYTYSTPLYYHGKIEDTTLIGDLIVVGSGDPTISGRFNKDTDDLTKTFREWAAALKKLGIRSIKGDIIGDDDYFDDEYFGKGWYPDERGEWYSAEISALSFNDNCIDVHWQGARKPQQPAIYRINPETPYVTFISRVETGKRDSDVTIDYKREDKSNKIVAHGSISARKKRIGYATIYNPTLFFVTVLKETLEREGIKVLGKPMDIDELPDKAPYRTDLTLVATYTSPPLSEIIKVIHIQSQNFYADQLFKTLGKIRKGEGRFIAASEAVSEFLHKENLYRPGHVMIDGSGLSHLNRVSPEQLVAVMRFMHGHKEAKTFFDTLPRGGKGGTLSSRFGASEQERSIGERVRGKTGWLGSVESLSGILTNAADKEFFYAILVTGFEGSHDGPQKLVDQIVVQLASSKIL